MTGHQHTGGCCGSPSPQVHTFWDSQPVAVSADDIGGVIEKPNLEAVRKTEGSPLPAGFEWKTVDIKNAEEMKQVYMLLTENYVEDVDALFRFDYSADFLRWALDVPHAQPEWYVGVVVSSSQKLVAFISAVPGRMRFGGTGGLSLPVGEVNFLCVHKKLRSKRLTPVLIKEITRRINLANVWQAVYTAGVQLPAAVSEPRYYHRLLNVKKLVDIGFTALPPNTTLARHVRLLKLPTASAGVAGLLKPMEPRHVKQVAGLLREHLKEFKYAPEFATNEEVGHWLLPRDKVVYTYVVETDATAGNSRAVVTDFVSFYHLPSSCLSARHADNVRLEAVYMFYTVATSMELKDLVEAALHVAAKEGFDVFNCLDIMHNTTFLEELKFGRGDGVLHYYIYNYRLPKYTPQEIGLLLL